MKFRNHKDLHHETRPGHACVAARAAEKATRERQHRGLQDLHRRGSIDWAKLETPNVLIDSIGWKSLAPSVAPQRAAVEALLRLALSDLQNGNEAAARMFLLEDVHVADGRWTVSPIQNFIINDWRGAMALFLEAGFDPLAKREKPALSTIECAELFGTPEFAALLKAHAARVVATRAVQDINRTCDP